MVRKTSEKFLKDVKTEVLCSRCAALKMESGKCTAKKITGANQKVICSKCGNSRYGGTYEVTQSRKAVG